MTTKQRKVAPILTPPPNSIATVERPRPLELTPRPVTSQPEVAAALPSLASRHMATRMHTLALIQELTPEDCQAQSMPDASPAKWHLAHTTWFFEAFVLKRINPGYRPFDARYDHLFNSYYNGIGEAAARAQRGLLTRPGLQEILEYRAHIDELMSGLLARSSLPPDITARIELGIQHEQQHQELLLTDIKHLFSLNPLRPAFRRGWLPRQPSPPSLSWHKRDSGFVTIGADSDPQHFAYDHEGPRQQAWLTAHAIANRPVTNGEYLDFIRSGGYRTPTLWLSDGWVAVQSRGWQRPLYWNESLDGAFTLRGAQALDPHEAVSHLSYYEADAFARWAGARLPREAEWEAVAATVTVRGNFAESERLHPAGASESGPTQLFGDVWEWTASPFAAYPAFSPLQGVLGEYNGKFMCNQFVLRGGSCVSSQTHLRASYRNFFPPDARWQLSGLRLAKDLP